MHQLSFLKPASVKGKIRVGVDYDGGYVVYGKVLAETDVLLNYGVGWETSFEECFNEKTGKPVIMFDPTLFGKHVLDYSYMLKHAIGFRFKRVYKHVKRNLHWAKKFKQLEARNIQYIREGIAPAKNGDYDSIANHIARFNLQDKQILLKMDIEGGEFDIFDEGAIFRSLENVNQIILELHDLHTRLHDVQRIMQKLGEEFELIHVHGNNHSPAFMVFDLQNNGRDNAIVPEALEVTFVRKSKIDPADRVATGDVYPTPGLDFPNDPNKADYPLVFA